VSSRLLDASDGEIEPADRAEDAHGGSAT